MTHMVTIIYKVRQKSRYYGIPACGRRDMRATFENMVKTALTPCRKDDPIQRQLDADR
jgi:hypothetical protein